MCYRDGSHDFFREQIQLFCFFLRYRFYDSVILFGFEEVMLTTNCA